jgi:hypothetical protein
MTVTTAIAEILDIAEPKGFDMTTWTATDTATWRMTRDGRNFVIRRFGQATGMDHSRTFEAWEVHGRGSAFEAHDYVGETGNLAGAKQLVTAALQSVAGAW